MAKASKVPQSGATLHRVLSLPLLTFYGLGTILGAGIYVLVGEVAASAGMAAPLSFLFAGVVAGVTAFSYAELAARIPLSAGEAAYLRAAFDGKLPAMLAGWGVVLTGIVSAATIANGFYGYLNAFIELPRTPAIAVTVLFLGGLAAWGVGLSVGAASVVTALELAGLLLVCGLSIGTLGDIPQRLGQGMSGADIAWSGVFVGAFLAFFAFVGFEDIVNMAEETRNPTRTVPRAIILAMLIATTLYVLVAAVAVLAVPPDQLAGEKAPMVKVIEHRGEWARVLIGLISLLAVINGALIQIIMASRVMYGMAKQGLAPLQLAKVHAGRRTPLLATALATLAVLVLALALPILTLARTTSTITLCVFALVNIALWRIKRRDAADHSGFTVPGWLPPVGIILCLACLLAGWLPFLQG